MERIRGRGWHGIGIERQGRAGQGKAGQSKMKRKR